jgi:hypothetical protein
MCSLSMYGYDTSRCKLQVLSGGCPYVLNGCFIGEFTLRRHWQIYLLEPKGFFWYVLMYTYVSAGVTMYERLLLPF